MDLKENLSVRDFDSKDAEILFSIILRTANFNEKDRKVAIDLIETFIDHPYDGSHLECITKDGKVIGFIYYEEAPLSEGVIEIYYVAIDPLERNKGYGKFFFKELEKRFRSSGVRIILLETSSIDEYLPTQRFYESLGYKAILTVKDYYRLGDDKITYEKRLS